MKIVKIGIASQEEIRERALAIAKGELKPKKSDPKIWFTSLESLTQTMNKNLATGLNSIIRSQ
jgi:predicted transcriptional regulator